MLLPLPVLSNRVHWLINLRWVACGGVVAVVWLTSSVLQVIPDPTPLYFITAGMVLYNSIFAYLAYRHPPVGTTLDRTIVLQMTFDQISLAGLLYFSSMIHNPFIFYFVFHMTIAALLIHGRAPYGLAGLASLLVGGILGLEYLGWIPSHNLTFTQSSPLFSESVSEMNGIYLVGYFIAFSTTLWITVYFTASIHNYMHQAEAVMRQKEKMLGISQLVAGIAHQISNPLDGAQNCLRSIGRSIKNDDHLLHYVNLISQALDRIERTARRVQSFARPHGLKLESVDVNKVVEAMIELLGSTVSKTIQIQTVLGNVPPVLGDFHTLQEVLFHLSTNALAAMPNGGKLVFRTFSRQMEAFEQNPQVAIEVVDTGCGIPRDNYERIFEPFFTTRSENGGTGLGLSLCRILIFEMGGRIEMESVVNQGSTFRIFLNTTKPIVGKSREFV